MRLTNDTRESIRNLALTAAFKKEQEASAKQEHRLTVLCYNSLYTASLRKAVAAAPNGWIATSSEFIFNVQGEQFRLTAETPLPVPASHRYSQRYTLKSSDLSGAVSKHARAKEELQQRRKHAREALTVMLNSVSTLKKLFEIWPEGQAFYKDAAPNVSNLPTVHVSELNKLLNLKAAA